MAPRVLTPVLFSALCGLVAAAQSAPPRPAPAPATQTPAAPAGRGGGRGGPAVVSPQIEADGRVTFRVLAPNATSVTVGSNINGSLIPIRMRLRRSPRLLDLRAGGAAPRRRPP